MALDGDVPTESQNTFHKFVNDIVPLSDTFLDGQVPKAANSARLSLTARFRTVTT